MLQKTLKTHQEITARVKMVEGLISDLCKDRARSESQKDTNRSALYDRLIRDYSQELDTLLWVLGEQN